MAEVSSRRGTKFETLSRILTSILSLMTRLRMAEIHSFVSEERKLHYHYTKSPMQWRSYNVRPLPPTRLTQEAPPAFIVIQKH